MEISPLQINLELTNSTDVLNTPRGGRITQRKRTAPVVVDIGAELRRELAFRGRITGLFRSPEFKELVETFMQQKEVETVEKKTLHSRQRSPFQTLLSRCESQAEQLMQSVQYISIYGRTKVGKSSIGNALLGKDLFPAKKNPATSCACIVSSGGSDNMHLAKVTMSPSITSGDDITNIFQLCGLNDPELDNLLKEAQINPLVDINLLWKFVGLPVKLRNYSVLDRVEVTMPLFGIEEKGIGLIDCPGTGENKMLNLKAIQYTQRSSIIIFCFRIETPLSSEDNDVKHIKFQQEVGKHIIYVLNKDSSDPLEGLKEKVLEFRNAFGNATLHIIDIKEDLEKPNFQQLKGEICTYLQERSKYMVGGFIHSFQKLIRTQHLFICRIISMHMEHASVGIPNLPQKHNKEEYLKKAAEIRNSIVNLGKNAEKFFEEDKKQFTEWFRGEIKSCSQSIRDNQILSRPELVQFIPPESNIFTKLFPREPTPFEESIKKRLQRAFGDHIDYRLVNYTSAKKKVFGQWLLLESQKIESESQRVKSEFENTIWNRQTQEFFKSVEIGINSSSTISLHVAVPSILGVAGVAGAGVVGGIFLAGLISATFATSGGVLFGLLAIGGFGGALGARLFSNTTEEETKKEISNSFFGQLEKTTFTPQFTNFVKEQLGDWHSIVEEVKECLTLNLLEIESLSMVDSISLGYDKLCKYIKMREDLTTFVLNLKDEVQSFSWHFNAMKALIQEKAKIGNHENCFVCQEKIISCGHLCRRCDILMGDKCPLCTNLNWVIPQIKRPNDEYLLQLLTGELEDGLKKSKGKKMSDSVFPNVATVEPLLEKDLKEYHGIISRFVEYSLKKYKSGEHSIDGILQEINYLIAKIISNYTPEGGLPYHVKRVIIRILHELIFPPMSELLDTGYKKLYQRQNLEFLEVCENCPSYRFPKESLQNERHPAWEEAKEHLCTMSFCKTPFEKVVCVNNMYNAVLKTQRPVVIGGDELADAITHVLFLAKYSQMISDMSLITDSLLETNFLDNSAHFMDAYLIQVVHGICTQFKNIADFVMTQAQTVTTDEESTTDEVVKTLEDIDRIQESARYL